MSYFDLALLIVLAGFTLNGLAKGLIRLLGHFVGLVVGAFIASHFYLQFYQWSQSIFGGRESLGKILSFVIVFVVVTMVVNWSFVILEKIFNVISVIPFTKIINRLLGAALGFFEGSLFIGLILFVISRYAWMGSLFGDQLIASKFVPFFLSMVKIIMPFLPTALKTLQSLI